MDSLALKYILLLTLLPLAWSLSLLTREKSVGNDRVDGAVEEVKSRKEGGLFTGIQNSHFVAVDTDDSVSFVATPIMRFAGRKLDEKGVTTPASNAALATRAYWERDTIALFTPEYPVYNSDASPISSGLTTIGTFTYTTTGTSVINPTSTSVSTSVFTRTELASTSVAYPSWVYCYSTLCTTVASANSVITAPPSKQPKASSKLAGGAIAGIVVGIVLFLTLVSALLFWRYRRIKRNSCGPSRTEISDEKILRTISTIYRRNGELDGTTKPTANKVELDGRSTIHEMPLNPSPALPVELPENTASTSNVSRTSYEAAAGKRSLTRTPRSSWSSIVEPLLPAKSAPQRIPTAEF